MDFDKYQDATRETAIYPEEIGLIYTTLGLTGESGEVSEKLKKYLREDDDQYIEEMEDELGDVLWYLARVADELDLSLDEIAESNLDKLLDRKERDKLTGSGDNR